MTKAKFLYSMGAFGKREYEYFVYCGSMDGDIVGKDIERVKKEIKKVNAEWWNVVGGYCLLGALKKPSRAFCCGISRHIKAYGKKIT